MTTISQNNVNIILDSFFAYKTYSGLLAGLPNNELNKRIVKRIPGNIERALGNCKIVQLPPKIKLKNKITPYLPKWIYAARLHAKAINKHSDGSMLCLVWFSDSQPDQLINNLSYELKKIDWNTEAEDFYF